MNTTFQQIVESKCKKGVFGYTIVAKSEKASLKKSRTTKEPTPSRFAVITKLTAYTNAALGVSYEVMVNNRLEKKGEERSFQAQAASGRTRVNAFFDMSLDGSKCYLKMGFRANTIVVSRYYDALGNELMGEELEMVKSEYMSAPSKGSRKQEEAGLTNEEQVIYIAPNIDNILSLSQGEDNVLYVAEQ